MEQYTTDALWCKMPLDVACDDRLSKADLQVYSVIACHAGMRGPFWAKQGDLAALACCNRETFSRSLGVLREYGYVRTAKGKNKGGLLWYMVPAHTKAVTPDTNDDPVDDLANFQPAPRPTADPARAALVEAATDLWGPAGTPTEAKRRRPDIDELLAAGRTPDELRRATEYARTKQQKYPPTLHSVTGKIGELLAAVNAVASTIAEANPTARDEAAATRRARDAARGVFYPTHPAGHKCAKCAEGKRQWQQEQSVATMQPQPPERVSAT